MRTGNWSYTGTGNVTCTRAPGLYRLYKARWQAIYRPAFRAPSNSEVGKEAFQQSGAPANAAAHLKRGFSTGAARGRE